MIAQRNTETGASAFRTWSSRLTQANAAAKARTANP
jgi:hypothetical protein